ncbi:hypothetical protein APA_1301 [Pseudanabaena sp. lw0831]|uniref:hypothetical protein n=1 Tax=Pseudanabaena sp. lw0831 TaxID=1357935 RepID=UPI0019155110|nr:hypothetical protein [Pseudanabaena sp. lw0831]GBO53394.1 hypothetical protein APA_1301 [Pseudanabaena sp. lw0831]
MFSADKPKEKLYLVTGVSVAIDVEDGILIAGILSDSPFAEDEQKNVGVKLPVANFAFTKKQAIFLRDRLNEFLNK